MKRIAIYCVTYHSYEALHNYLESIEEAAKEAARDVDVDVFVADNTDSEPQTIDYEAKNSRLRVFPFHENSGYFGAIGRAMKEASPICYDYVIVSNVDLRLEKDFFNQLASHNFHEDTGWIAPRIWSEFEMRDRNPQILTRYSLKKLKILKTFYQYPLLDTLYTRTFYRRKKWQSRNRGEIYAGHGSLIILTHRFFEHYPQIDYPVFLFCEEIYLAELCQKAGLKVTYEPSISVNDSEHVSTGHMRHSFYCRCNYEAIRYIIQKFY